MKSKQLLPATWQCSDEWTVFRAKSDDTDGIMSVYNACNYLHEVDEHFIRREKQYFQEIVESLHHRENDCDYQTYCYCLKDNETAVIMGYFQCIADYPDNGTLWISAMIVHPDYHGRNVGKKFIASLEGSLSGDTIKKISLRVSLKNYPALRFWLANGFNTILHFEGERRYTSQSNAVCFVLTKYRPPIFIHLP